MREESTVTDQRYTTSISGRLSLLYVVLFQYFITKLAIFFSGTLLISTQRYKLNYYSASVFFSNSHKEILPREPEAAESDHSWHFLHFQLQ